MSEGGTADHDFVVGDAFVESRIEDSPYYVVFHDDGETAYLYGLDARREEQPILDDLHIYNVADMKDSVSKHHLRIVWPDSTTAALLINGYAHAMFDFDAPLAMCVDDFPPPSRNWDVASHAWDETAFQAALPGVPSEWAYRRGRRPDSD